TQRRLSFAPGDFTNGGDDPIDLAARGVTRTADPYQAGIGHPEATGDSGRIKITVRCENTSIRQFSADLCGLFASDRKGQSRRSRCARSGAKNPDAGDTAELVQKMSQQRRTAFVE